MTTYRPKEEIREGFEVYDERFRQMLPEGVELERHFTGTAWAEGPVYFSDGDYVVWSDIPNDRMMRWSISEGASVFGSRHRIYQRQLPGPAGASREL